MTTTKKTEKKKGPKLVKGATQKTPKGKAPDKGNNPFVNRNVPAATENIFEETAKADDTDQATKKVNDELAASRDLLADLVLLLRAASCGTATIEIKAVAISTLRSAMANLNGIVGRARTALKKLEEK